MSQSDLHPPDPVTPSAGLAMVRLQLLAMVGMGVHYVALGSADGTYPAVCRAAIITEALDPDFIRISVQVLNPQGTHYLQNVPYDPAGAPGTWHWPERV